MRLTASNESFPDIFVWAKYGKTPCNLIRIPWLPIIGKIISSIVKNAKIEKTVFNMYLNLNFLLIYKTILSIVLTLSKSSSGILISYFSSSKRYIFTMSRESIPWSPSEMSFFISLTYTY